METIQQEIGIAQDQLTRTPYSDGAQPSPITAEHNSQADHGGTN